MRKWLILFPCITFMILLKGQLATGRTDCSIPVPELFQQISPSVVYITAVTIDPFALISRVRISIGSGFIIHKDGLILTNSHVVFRGQAIMVTLENDMVYEARILGADPILDLAVIRISAPKELPVLHLGNSDTLQVGEEVIAIGNPAGLEQTLTRGVISGINRILPTSPMSLTLPLIQTDAAINPGNSGGPLVNRCGDVIGIMTSILVETENIGFAIPINITRDVLSQLINHGRVIRPWLGIHGKLIESKKLRTIFNFPLVDGFLVETVEPGSPAENAGIQAGGLSVAIGTIEFLFGGDIITAINGKQLNDPDSFMDFIQSLKVGDNLNMKINRSGKSRELELKLLERPILPGDLPSPCDERMISPLIWGFR
ncbi:MAG: trypsin-like peptidase domain-containing protein [Thermodesulfobacteriota bacterium]|nr:trypsin-like peptidase domain-containing protein [Thermodesulfobacteriota bacterium]